MQTQIGLLLDTNCPDAARRAQEATYNQYVYHLWRLSCDLHLEGSQTGTLETGTLSFSAQERRTCFRGLAGCLFLSESSLFPPFSCLVAEFSALFTTRL